MHHFFPLRHCDNKQLFKELEQAACKCFGFAEALSSRHLARSRQDCDSLTNSVCRQERGAATAGEGRSELPLSMRDLSSSRCQPS